MNNHDKTLALSAALVVIGVGVYLSEYFANRKKARTRSSQITKLVTETEEFNDSLKVISDDLDRRLAAARFWDIVTRSE
jgi:CHASE3 domain sensor protein